MSEIVYFSGEGAGGLKRSSVRAWSVGDGQERFLAPHVLHLGHPGVGIEYGYGEKLVAGLFDPLFHSQPVEHRVLGLLRAGCDFDLAASEMG